MCLVHIGCMQLSEFMDQHNLRDEDMVARLAARGVKVDRSHINRIRRGKIWPGTRLAAEIKAETGGLVTVDELLPFGAGE